MEKTYEYSVENRLAAVYDADNLLLAAAYDGDGNRVFQLNYNLHTDDDWKDNSGNGNNKDNKGSVNNGKGNDKNNGSNGNAKKYNSKSEGTDDAGYGNATNAEEYNSQNQSGILFPVEEEVSATERSLIDKIKTTGREKDYELIEYLNDVNREYAEVLVEQNINGKTDTSYVYGVERLSLDRFNGSTGYYLYDPRGSVTGITNEEGQIYQSYRYGVYGEVTFGAPQYENEYTYNGESYNPNIESQYLRARYYCVVTADFLTEDSYLGDITEPLTLNRYNYCISSPLNYVDPSGNKYAYDVKGKVQYNPDTKKFTGSKKDLEANFPKAHNILPKGGIAEWFEKDVEIRDKVEDAEENRADNGCGKEREVDIPSIVKGNVNGTEVEFFPLENWGGIGYGAYGKGVQKDEQGRYKIAVGPKVIDADYPDEGKIWADDFDDFSHNIKIVLKNKETSQIKEIECVVVDIKAHSFNEYPVGQPFKTGDVATLDVESGLIQTGIAYPNSNNAEKDLAFSKSHMNGTVIEFAGSDVDFKLSEYELVKLIVQEK